MANQKALIGVLIVGGGIAAYMMTKDKTPTTPELAPAGGVPSYTDENGNGNGNVMMITQVMEMMTIILFLLQVI